MSFWFRSCFDAFPAEILSDPFAFTPSRLPPFYKSLLIVWQGLNGSFSASRRSLVFGSLCPHFCSPVSAMTTKSCYLYLLSENVVQPHCVLKFASTFGVLYWSTTWDSLTLFDLDHQVIDLHWKITHGILYTALHLVLLDCQSPFLVFLAPLLNLTSIYFSLVRLLKSVLSWLQS